MASACFVPCTYHSAWRIIGAQNFFFYNECMSEFNSACHPFCRWEISQLVSDEARIATRTVKIEQMPLTHSRTFVSWSKHQTYLNPEPESSAPGHFPRRRDLCLPMGCDNFIWVIRKKKFGIWKECILGFETRQHVFAWPRFQSLLNVPVKAERLHPARCSPLFRTWNPMIISERILF